MIKLILSYKNAAGIANLVLKPAVDLLFAIAEPDIVVRSSIAVGRRSEISIDKTRWFQRTVLRSKNAI